METAGFVPEPSCGRGTISIIWSCLATIFFVVWTVQHIDYRESISRVILGASTFFIPEAMPAAAVAQLILARRLRRRLHNLPGWDSWALEQAFLVVKNGVRDKRSGEILTADRLVELAQRGQHKQPGAGIHIGLFPSKQDINKRSKMSWLEKIMAGSQALWFSANMVSRLVGGHQVTLLEDVTLAYACCGLIAMVAWFHCPQDIQDPFEVNLMGVESLTEKESGERCLCSLQIVGDRCLSGLVIPSLFMVTGVHLGAWQYPFPTVAEAWVWRSCALVGLVALPVGLVLLCFRERKVFLLSMTALVLARLALWTVACAAFRRAPVSAFDTPNWCDYWGHIGK
ncbi:hypothetical protein DHEL01_v202996 [Diaporthe helianthi]|uniref:Transmembrane protein n=1 Tax=Diaporthe helianthi TaxID=158607 RepID=A0A2P5I7Y5_DIAHE|nr:hypothetical protein DHEL01_v202996 [Diaporthe helianthi]